MIIADRAPLINVHTLILKKKNICFIVNYCQFIILVLNNKYGYQNTKKNRLKKIVFSWKREKNIVIIKPNIKWYYHHLQS